MILQIAVAKRTFGGVFLFILAVFTLFASALKSDGRDALVDHDHGYDSSYETERQNVFSPARSPPHSPQSPTHDAPILATTNALQELHNALSVMQKQYFALWLGKWTTAIDWTSAVMGTHISGTLYSLSHSLSYTMPGTFDKERKLDVEAQMVENEINKYFAQSVAYYFGEEYFSLRTQANDDMLWVVLGWLESIKFIGSHSERHYLPTGDGDSKWHGAQFVPSFAHRARVFYELASEGWDWKLCGGGMTWNPHLLPYKNAITNQLFISASVGMYLHFPGDDNCSPFMGARDGGEHPDRKAFGAQEHGDAAACDSSTSRSTYDPIYLTNAINGYDWLKNSGMTNEQGLYVDGFHIRGYATNHSKTDCDERNEMVYTYNQGVILSGLLGLWEATGNLTYLEDGHELVRNVIRATGWTDTEIAPMVSMSPNSPRRYLRSRVNKYKSNDPSKLEWSGLGSSGILTEICDPSGLCSQDGQTFKGIFFHHLVSFCTPLPKSAVRKGRTHAADKVTAALHRRSCNEYAPWVLHNAEAAAQTKDSQGRFGMWWGAGIHDQNQWREEGHQTGKQKPRRQPVRRDPTNVIRYPQLEPNATDYRNDLSQLPSFYHPDSEINLEHLSDRHVPIPSIFPNGETPTGEDPNSRGRGRTVETQGGGVAVTRAMWEFLRRYDGVADDLDG